MNKIRITVHIQIINIKYNHSRTDNANQTKQHGYEKYKPYPPLRIVVGNQLTFKMKTFG